MALTISVVIPVKRINSYVRESSAYLSRLSVKAHEVLVCPDEDSGEKIDGATIVPTGAVGPAEKRDMAVKIATGDIIAFLDDDAYPRPDWLEKAVPHFSDIAVAAVGGPALTPPTDSVRRKASGFVFSSLLGGGGLAYRYVPGSPRDVDDFPSVNLLVRKEVFEQIGGFDTNFWPGEDTKLCLDITRKLGMRIAYDPEVVVWHHRRPLFGPHLTQVYNYAVHRGYFAKRFPETSRRPLYFAPSAFVLTASLGSLSFIFSPRATGAYLALALVYLAAVTLSAWAAAGPRYAPLVAPGIIMTHFVYGAGFLRGVLIGKLRR